MGKYEYKYPRPALTTDAIVFGVDKKLKKVQVLLILRKNDPFKNQWAFPGGFVDIDETVENCVVRELEEETGLKQKTFEQLITVSELERDPRTRTISVVFWSLIKTNYDIKGLDDAKDAKWFSVTELPELAFDHKKILEKAIKKLKFRLSAKMLFFDFFGELSDDEIKIIDDTIKKI